MHQVLWLAARRLSEYPRSVPHTGSRPRKGEAVLNNLLPIVGVEFYDRAVLTRSTDEISDRHSSVRKLGARRPARHTWMSERRPSSQPQEGAPVAESVCPCARGPRRRAPAI